MWRWKFEISFYIFCLWWVSMCISFGCWSLLSPLSDPVSLVVCLWIPLISPQWSIQTTDEPLCPVSVWVWVSNLMLSSLCGKCFAQTVISSAWKIKIFWWVYQRCHKEICLVNKYSRNISVIFGEKILKDKECVDICTEGKYVKICVCIDSRHASVRMLTVTKFSLGIHKNNYFQLFCIFDAQQNFSVEIWGENRTLCQCDFYPMVHFRQMLSCQIALKIFTFQKKNQVEILASGSQHAKMVLGH